VVLITAISVVRRQPQQESDVSSFVVPTSLPVNRSTTNSFGNSAISTIPTLMPDQQNAITNFKNFIPYDSDALALEYSPYSNKVYIEKRSDQANAELQKFLEENNLTDIYNKYPNLFKIITSSIKERINEEEQVFNEPGLQTTETNTTPTPVLTYEQQREINQTNAFNAMVRNIIPFNAQYFAPQYERAIPLSNGVTIQNSGSIALNPNQKFEGAQLGSFKARVKWDFGESNLRLCKEQPGTLAIVAYLKKRFGSYASYGIGKDCKTGTGKVYAHLAGRGVDYFFHAKNSDELRRGNEAFAWLITNAQNVGIQYAKFWRLHWSPQGGLHCVDNTITPNDMYSHSNHIHFELNLAAAQKQTPFFTKNQSVDPTVSINQEICPLLDPRLRP